MRLPLNPYPDIRPDHPLVVREARRLRWLKRGESPERYSIKIILLVLGLVLILYVGWLVLNMPRPPSRLDNWWFLPTTAGFFYILFGVSIVASIPLDYVSITASLNSISGEIISGNWDLLRLTQVRDSEIIVAKYASSQLRAWRTTMWVIGLRAATVLSATIVAVGDYASGWRAAYNSRADITLLLAVLTLVTLPGLLGIFVLEPLWRMRAITALGMVISARVRDGAPATLLAVGALLLLWLVQAIVVAVVATGIYIVVFVAAAFGVGALCAPPAVLLVVFSVVKGFYSTLKLWSLRQVARRLVSLT
jgi:hypothetical protein